MMFKALVPVVFAAAVLLASSSTFLFVDAELGGIKRRLPSTSLSRHHVAHGGGGMSVIGSSEESASDSIEELKKRTLNALHHVARGGGGGMSVVGSSKESGSDSIEVLKKRTLNTLHQTSFLMVASTAMVMFMPLPSLTRHLEGDDKSYSPQARAIQILSLLSAISAAIELFLSPLVGVVIDVFGRKRPSIAMHALIVCANLAVVCHPSVFTICISRSINVVVGGFLVIVANSVIADMFTSSKSNSGSEQMGSVLGRQAATVSLGFLLGSVAGGRLTEFDNERVAYGVALLFSLLAIANLSFRMLDSLQFTQHGKKGVDDNMGSILGETLGDKLLEAPLSSVQLLYHYGSHMRTLAILLILQSIPIFMGDMFQMFAKEEWGLQPRQFANMVALFGILGIVSNLSLPVVLQYVGGMKNFSLFAILSSLLFPLTSLFTNSYHHVLAAGCIGLYASAQKVGTSTAMTSLATELGVPQGKLQGEKASMLALLKIGSPILYSTLYLKGKAWSSKSITSGNIGLDTIMSKIGSKLPFVLNIFLGLCALAVTSQNL